MADVNNLKAEFGSAYVRAVAHTAGYFVQEANRMMDADGVDLTIFARGSRGQMRSPRLDVQLKTTQHGLEDEAVTLDLPVKNYDELRAAGYQTPRILVVVVVPPTPRDWLVATEEQPGARGFSRRADSRADFAEVGFRDSSSSTTTVAIHGTQPRQNHLREATREENHGLLASSGVATGHPYSVDPTQPTKRPCVFDCRVLPGFMSSNSRHSWLASARETCNGSPDCSAKDSCAQCGTIDFVSPYKGMVASGVW